MSESDPAQNAPQPRQFTTPDGSTYTGVPADEFEDFSAVDHRAVDENTGEVRA